MQHSDFAVDQIDAIVFDVIGTLVDDDTAIARAAERLAREAGLIDSQALRDRWVEVVNRRMDAVVSGADPWQPHQQIMTDSAEEAVTSLGGRSSSTITDLVSSIDSDYPAWPDVNQATRALRRDRLVIGVSNGDLESLARLANINSINWDMVLSTAAVRTFKPAPSAYRYAIYAMRIDPARTLFVAAHPWDLRAAQVHGFRTAYIARPGAERPSADDDFDLVADDLLALVSRLERP